MGLAVALLPEPLPQTRDYLGAIMVIAFTLGMGAAMMILLDVVNILFRGKTIFSRKPLDPSFQADFIAIMLKFEAMHKLGDMQMFMDIARFFSELPVSDGKRIAEVMEMLDVGLFQEVKKSSGIAPNPPRKDKRGQELKRVTADKKEEIRKSASRVSELTSQADKEGAIAREQSAGEQCI